MSDSSGAKQEQPCLVRGLGRKCAPWLHSGMWEGGAWERGEDGEGAA